MEKVKEITPWTVITILGCLSLGLIDFWRDFGETSVPLIRGTLPNFIAVPTLTFGVLMIQAPKRIPFEPAFQKSQDRWFWALWILMLCTTVTWELMQINGSLIFDLYDLYATFVGAVTTIMLYLGLRHLSFTQINQEN